RRMFPGPRSRRIFSIFAQQVSVTTTIGGREDWFPTSVWGFEHPEAEALNASLLRLILTERDADPRGLVDRSTVLGWHSRDDLHHRPDFAPLMQFIEAGVAEAVRFQKWDAKQVTPLIASCW